MLATVQLGGVRKLLEDRSITLDISPEATALLADQSYDPQYGARPLKRNIQRLILNPLAKMMLGGEVRDNETVRVAVVEKAGERTLEVSGNHPKRS